MAQVIQGLKNMYGGTMVIGEGTSKFAQGSTTVASEGFGLASKAFKFAAKLVGGSPNRRSQRLAAKQSIKYYSPKRSSPKRKSKSSKKRVGDKW